MRVFEPRMGRIRAKKSIYKKKKKKKIELRFLEPKMGQEWAKKYKFFQPKCLISKGISRNLSDHQNIQNIIKLKMQKRFPDSQRN